MPGQKGKSKFFSSLGDKAKKAFLKHKNDEVRQPGGDSLPPGINNGVAKFVDWKIDEYKNGANKGKDYLLLSAVVVSPEKHDGQKIAGRRTSYLEPLCDTPASKNKPTIEDHVAEITNMLKLLGVPTEDYEGLDGVDDALNALKEQGVLIRFRTRQGQATPAFPNPRTFEEWLGLAEGAEEGDASPDVEDDTGAVEEEEEAPKAKSGGKGGKKAPPVEEEEAEDDGEVDLDALAEAAAEDEDVQKQLTDIAVEAGISKKKVLDADSWADVVEMIREAQGGEGGEEAEEEEWAPAKEEVYGYKGLDKAGKPTKNHTDHEVVKVDAKAQTVDLKNLATNKVVKGVAWSKLKHDDS